MKRPGADTPAQESTTASPASEPGPKGPAHLGTMTTTTTTTTTTSTTPSATPSALTTTTSTGKRPYHRKAISHRSDRGNATSQSHRQDAHSNMIVLDNHQHPSDPNTLSTFCQSMLRISTLHIVQSSGFDAVQANPMSVLAECLGRYMTFLAESAKEFAEHSGRARITALDVVDGLSELGIDLEDLSEWMAENGGINAPEEGTAAATGTGAEGSGTTSSSNRPTLPSWKGADPGHVIYGKIVVRQ
jgi:histone H3/H4